MPQRSMEYPSSGKTSRRRFLKGTAGLGAATLAVAPAQQNNADSARHPIFAYVGSYSLPQGPDGSVGRGQGIYLFEMNPATGALVQRELFRRDTNSSFMALDRSRKHMYSVNWISNYQGTNSGSVSAYAVARHFRLCPGSCAANHPGKALLQRLATRGELHLVEIHRRFLDRRHQCELAFEFWPKLSELWVVDPVGFTAAAALFPLSASHESMKLELRLEAENAFNHPVFGTPDTYVGDPNFGVINYTAVGPRQGQLALKFYF